jgi:flavin reductase (DIM6/NTAB) family NADH-FMN oxidoreductase RutF
VLEGPRGPLLAGALGWLECELAAEHPAGDHTFFVGRVERAEVGADGEPLVRIHGGYA